jgi:calcium-translocating P-type ATPase
MVVEDAVDPSEPVGRLFRDLRTSRRGLTSREAQRRLLTYGTNELVRRGGRRWPRELARQFTHPLALLLWAAALLAGLAGTVAVAVAILAIIVLNAVFAFVQEVEAGRAVEALQQYLPTHAKVRRDRELVSITASGLVPGDILVLEEGDRISADARLIAGALEVDMSTLTGESLPVFRSAELVDVHVPLLQARELVFSGSSCTGGEAEAVVTRTGMSTEIGRIAALSERVASAESPLEQQVRRVARLIAAIAVLLGIAFLPAATLGAGLSFSNALVFAVGLIAGNVPEGLLPVITLALAIGVRALARRGALMKRLSAVETLGSTDVICTDKTGTITENRMRVARIWTPAGELDVLSGRRAVPETAELVDVMASCNNAHLKTEQQLAGDPTEIALLQAAVSLEPSWADAEPESSRLRHFHFDPVLKLMSTIDRRNGGIHVDTKGAPEAVLGRSTTIRDAAGHTNPLDGSTRRQLQQRVDDYAARGLRVLAFATRAIDPRTAESIDRQQAERDLCLLGLAAMLDPPRPEVADAVARCHSAGLRILVVTGDHPLTGAAIAHQVGIGTEGDPVITGEQLTGMSDEELARLLDGDDEIVFARASPEAKLRIADTLRSQGHVVAMTGDGVNDAPALRAADIGVAMGESGTDVAREASTMVLTDDNFATIVAAVEAGRVVYDNVRKFIFYIFTHATPEVVPFLVFALARGAIPLPLTVLLLLTFDVGTESLPALALGREPAEPGIMQRPPRRRTEGIIRAGMLVRAWLFLGMLVAALSLGGFFYVLLHAGWQPGDPVGAGHPLHHAYLQATTMTFVGMVMGQVGTAFAARTERASLRSVGVFTNRYLIGGIAVSLALTASIVYLPLFHHLLDTASLPPSTLAITLPFPFIVWGADELQRAVRRRRADRHPSAEPPQPRPRLTSGTETPAPGRGSGVATAPSAAAGRRSLGSNTAGHGWSSRPFTAPAH